jgi:hypothetical protein
VLAVAERKEMQQRQVEHLPLPANTRVVVVLREGQPLPEIMQYHYPYSLLQVEQAEVALVQFQQSMRGERAVP